MVVAIDLPEIASRVANKTVASKVRDASGIRCSHVWCSCVAAKVSDTPTKSCSVKTTRLLPLLPGYVVTDVLFQ